MWFMNQHALLKESKSFTLEDDCIDSEEKWLRLEFREKSDLSGRSSGRFHEEGGGVVILSLDLRV